MQEEKNKLVFGSDLLWKRIALVAGVFSFVICILLVANYIQIKKADPINMKVLNALVERLHQDPNDNQLREEIRTLDLLSRKAFFTNQWQIRMGSYLLLLGIGIVILSFQIIKYGKRDRLDFSEEYSDESPFLNAKARKWIAIGGIAIVAITLVFAYISGNELKNKFSQAVVLNTEQETDSTQQTNSIDEQVADTNKAISASDSVKSEVKGTTEQSVISESGDSKDNFPAFRGKGGYGIASQKNIPVKWDGKSGENVLWKVATSLPGYNSPVIWGDKLFLTGAQAAKREVYCIDTKTGKIIWTVPVEKIPNSASQAPKVSAETGFSASTVTTDGKGVYAIFANGDIIGIDMNGKKLWAQSLGLPQNHYGHSSSLIMFKDKVIVQLDQKTAPKLIALSAQTGKTIWSTTRNVKISWSSPIVVNTGTQTEIILAAEPMVAGYDPNTGQELWKIDCITGEDGPSLAYADGIVFSINEYSKLAAIKLGDQPTVLWESTEYLSDVPSPVANKDYLFVATSYGTVACYDTKTGTKYWEQEMNNSIYSSPIIAEGKVYLMDRTGIMHIFKADKVYTSVGEPKLGEKSDCTPAFANGRIYLRGEKNLYCIGK